MGLIDVNELLCFSSGMVQSVGANLSPDQTFGSIRSLSVTREVASFPLSRTPTPPPQHRWVILLNFLRPGALNEHRGKMGESSRWKINSAEMVQALDVSSEGKKFSRCRVLDIF